MARALLTGDVTNLVQRLSGELMHAARNILKALTVMVLLAAVAAVVVLAT